ncbi:MAG TPA: Flp1 family type IVb pilin [Clostridia bacterium]|nr:Flp1 family type IVb pilin [Clostridia bacterium]HPQ47071.1 Flp1 family type IVb pilin [Clostridia bacterium]HRX41297.1 Flp1 family type IVb pilin [Clostridia bacterium]
MKEGIKVYLSEKGMGTVEIVIIVAVLVGVALIFREAILNFVTDMIDSIFNDTEIIDKIKVD